MQVYIDGIVPVVDPTAYVHPTAVLIGDVIIGPGCYVGPNAALRGDFGRLILEEGAVYAGYLCAAWLSRHGYRCGRRMVISGTVQCCTVVVLGVMRW